MTANPRLFAQLLNQQLTWDGVYVDTPRNQKDLHCCSKSIAAVHEPIRQSDALAKIPCGLFALLVTIADLVLEVCHTSMRDAVANEMVVGPRLILHCGTSYSLDGRPPVQPICSRSPVQS